MTQKADLKKENHKEKYVQSKIDDFIPKDEMDVISAIPKNDTPQNEENKKESEEENLKQIQDEAILLQKKKLDEVEQSVSKRNSKKNKILNIIFFIVNVVVVAGILIYQLLKEDIQTIRGRFDAGSVFVIIVLLGLVIFCETAAFSYLLKISTGKWRFGLAYKVSQLGKYYDSVTPMATGGQPFQITYLKSHGTPIHTSLSIPLAKYVFSQIAWVITSFVCLVISWKNKTYGTFISIASVLGFIFSSIMLFVVLFLSICKTIGKKLVVRTLKLLHKMKIIKNYDKQYEKITKYISDFQDVMKQYARSPKDFIIMIFLSLAKNFVNYSMPFFIVKFFMPDIAGAMYIRMFVMTCLVDLSSSFFPLPGGTGMNEISFSAAFGAVVGKQTHLAWVLIIWRLCSYYYYLIQGVCILSYDFAYGNRKYKWEVVRGNLAQESELFKQEQINKFRTERARRRKSKNKSDIREYL